MLIKACLNGFRAPGEHEALPLSAEALARDARSTVEAGAGALHLHPRRADGTQTLGAEECGAAVTAIRAACPGIPVGLSTGIFIEPDVGRRLALVRAWDVLPDFVSVNFGESGAAELSTTLLERGVGIEAGLATPDDATAFIASGLAACCLRVLLEPGEDDAASALATADGMERRLDAAGVQLPRLLHGVEGAAWPVLDAALQRGHDIRIGLEDVLTLPGGRRARDNAELVTVACEHARQAGRL